MALDEKQIQTLKSDIAAARKKALNFALCLGKKPENSVLLIHRTKSGDTLQRDAKNAGETAKLANGTIVVKGKSVLLTCSDGAPSGCAKKVKDFLVKSTGLSMKVIILDPAGNTLEADGEDDDDDTGNGQQVATETTEDPDAAKLTKALEVLVKQAKALAPSSERTKIAKALDEAKKLIAARKLKTVPVVLKKIGEAIAKAPAAATGGASHATMADKPLKVWRAAREKAGGQITQLQSVMRSQNHPAFARIADKGFNGITGQLQVGLQVALMNVDSASADDRPKAVAKAREIVADFQSFLSKDKVVAHIEDNPFGVAITVRKDMGAALTAIDKALAG